jgi:integrase
MRGEADHTTAIANAGVTHGPAADALATALAALAAAAQKGPDALVELVKTLATESGAGDARNQSPSDNSIAAEKDFSPTPKEEPMYTWVSPRPYQHFKKWRVWFRGLDGKKVHRTFENEPAALAFIEKAKTELLVGGGHPIGDLIAEYIKHRTPSLKLSSIQTLDFRLRALADKRNAVPIEMFPWMKAWREKVAEQSTDSQYGIRGAAKGFIAFCMKAGLLRKDPLAEVEILGRKKRGKAQLHIDEARRFVDLALQYPDDPLAIASAAMVFTGLRPGEVMNLRVRDYDAGGTILWVVRSKTEAGRRGVEVTEVFRPYLANLVRNRGSMDYLFAVDPQRKRSSKDEYKQRRDALLRRTRSLCEEGKLPVVCSHSMRGLHSTLATGVGTTGDAVAKAMGHASVAVGQRHYIDQNVRENATLRRTLGLLMGSPVPAPSAVTRSQDGVTAGSGQA